MKVILLSLIIVLSGCGTSRLPPIQDTRSIYQENLLTECTDDTPLPKNYRVVGNEKVYDGSELMRVLLEWQKIYNACASTHNSLVGTIRDLQKNAINPKITEKR